MSFSIPILILAWKRPEKLKLLILKLKSAKPNKIYVSIDGPNNDRLCIKKVKETKDIIDKEINWKCSLSKNYETKNIGCKNAVSKGISWLFRFEEYGIILEEDCIPDLSFLLFAEAMLNKYKKDKSVFTITGDCFVKNSNKYKETYYYSKYPHCWGWATWKDRWDNFDSEIKFWPLLKQSKKWKRIHPNLLERIYWNKIMDRVFKNEIDSWAYPWAGSIWNKEGKTVTPMLNLVTNLGFEEDGTHTLDKKSKLGNKPVYEIKQFIGPKNREKNFHLDKECFYSTFFVISFKKLIHLLKNYLFKFINKFIKVNFQI